MTIKPVITDDLAIYLPLNEGTGTTTTDVSGNGCNGTLVGPTWNKINYNGNYELNFDGNDYVTVANAANLKITNDFSIVFWFKHVTGATYNYILSSTFDPNSGQFTGYSVNVYNGTIRLLKATGASTIVTITSTETTLNDGKWHHGVFIYDSVNGMRMYIDNKLSISNTDTTNIYYDATTPYLELGDFNNDGLHDYYYIGQLDEFRIYNKVLTPEEIKAIYNQTYRV